MSRSVRPAASRNRRTAARIATALLIVLALGGCGRKANPQPPADEPKTYPMPYPRS